MKIRFENKKEGDRGKKDIFPCFAIDIDKVVAWYCLGDDSLAIWLKGVPEPVGLTVKDMGEDNFCFLITILSQEFLDIDDLQFRTTNKASSNQ